jgi:predicted DNA-binding protein (UPF0251 family)
MVMKKISFSPLTPTRAALNYELYFKTWLPCGGHNCPGGFMRPTKARTIGCMPACRRFHPLPETGETAEKQGGGSTEVVTIGLDMLEAMRLVDAEGMNQEAAARSMDVSTPTLCRILGQGRRLAALALTTGSIINIEGGNIMYGNAMQGRHGRHFSPGRGGRQGQGTMQGGACPRSEGMGCGQGMGRRRCGAGRGGQGPCVRNGAGGGASNAADSMPDAPERGEQQARSTRNRAAVID